MPRTVIVSDCHFGYEGFNSIEFEKFLSHLREERNIDRFVLLGDVFDLWRADPIDSVSLAYPCLEEILDLGVEVCYVVGNHDYHNHVSCLKLKRNSFLDMSVSYPYFVLDQDTFLVHGDYFDIYNVNYATKAIYAVYEAIYHAPKPLVRSLDAYFWSPVDLLRKWVEKYRESPEEAQHQFRAEYLDTVLNLEDPREVDELDQGLEYLSENPELGVELFAPTFASADSDRLAPSSAAKGMQDLDTASARAMLSRRLSLELAREISGSPGIKKVIQGHTHKAENRSSEGHWNTGSWVDGESTYIDLEDDKVALYRFKDDQKSAIPESNN